MAVVLTPSRLLLVFAVVLLFGFLGNWIFRRTRIPDTLLLMLLGFGIGQLFDLDPAPFLRVMPYVGVLALIAILFDGGLGLKVNDLVKGLARAAVLSVGGFLFSVILVMLYGHATLGLTYMEAALLGAIVGGTSAVVVIPMLPGLKLGRRPETLLNLESALTDVLCVVVALSLAATLAEGGGSPFALGSTLASSFAVALVLGIMGGVGWLVLFERVRGTGTEYVWTLTALFFLYGVTELLGGSGPIAVLTFGILLGNAGRITKLLQMTERRFSYTVGRSQGELVFFVRSFFFVFLGLVFDPAFLSYKPLLSSPLLKALGLVVVLIIARIGAVALATIGDRKLIEHRARFVLLLPRGLAAAVLASIPAAAPYNLTAAESFVSYAFAVVLFSNILATFAGLVGADLTRWRPRRRPTPEQEVDRLARGSEG